MFGSRRHRRPNPPLTAATANPNAATAAAAVFKRHESNPSLSAAAAAAALRARPTTPTRVADVQTRRTVRRSASSFSDDMPPVPALPRDMDATSRHAGQGAQREMRHQKANSLGTGGTPVRLASQKLASGEAPSWFGAAKLGDLGNVRRTDPAMASPPSSPLPVLAQEEDPSEGARPGSQASSINFSYPTRARRGSANVLPGVDSYSASPAQPPAADHQPTARVKHQPRGQAAAPPATRPSSSSSQALVYDPNSRRMVRQADLLAIQHVQQAVLHASQQPTGPKKKKRTPQRAGSHLAAGTMGRAQSQVSNTPPSTKAQPSSPDVQDQPQQLVQPAHPIEPAPTRETRADVDEEPVVKAIISSPRIEAKKLEEQRAQKPVELPRTSAPAVPTSAPAASDETQFVVRRQPSVIREGPEPEDAQDEKKTQTVISDALDAVPARRTMQAGLSVDTRQPATPPQNITLPLNPSSGNSATARVEQKPKLGPVDVSEDRKPKPGATEHGRAVRVLRERTHSSSPARQAHFGPVQDSLMVKHSPPPRSISPRKSAMKHTSPPRGASPSGDTSEASGSVNQEPAVARKKSVRVSFDDGGDGVVAESASVNRNASPLAVSPLYSNRHSWLNNLGRGQDLPSFDDDAVMKPRPALPSFGSVRDRKPRDASPAQFERPLVRPKGETRYTSPSPLLPSPPLGSSTDHALGAILSNENGRVEEGTGHLGDTLRHTEPLPPVVTSVEGNGYLSDGSDTSSMLSSEYEPPRASSPRAGMEPRPEPPAGAQIVPHNPPVNGSAAGPRSGVVLAQVAMEQDTPAEPQIPAISVSQPTPLGTEIKARGQYFMDVPGGFPDDESDQSTRSAVERSSQATAVAEPTEVTPQGNLPEHPAVETIQPIAAESSSDSDGDIYSDAYEDLSEMEGDEMEGDGFQSLDAVVESPLQQSPRPAVQPEQASREAPSPAAPEQPSIEPPSPTAPQETPKLQTEISSATTAVDTPPADALQDDWEKAKAYWRSLTAEKRAQLEKEAKEEAGTEGDKDEAQPEAKPKKKKTVERRNSERKALAAQQTMTQQAQERAAHPDRSYMIKPGEQWTGEDELAIPQMRMTMRNEPQQAPVAPIAGSRLRKSMRANGSGPSSQEPRTAETRPTSRRSEPSPVVVTPTNIGHRRSATQAENIPPPVMRRGSTGSESSFKRSRSAKGQGFGFRHSMRPTSPPSAQAENHASKRFSLRTLSPAGSVSPTGTQMRTTLRDSSAGKKTSNGIRMPSFSLSYGGGKKSGSKASGNKKTGSRFSSRLADSSNEDGGKGVESGFRSRFEDSSDDEPVMPIPALLPKSASAPYAAVSGGHLRKESSIASTALPEELEESEASHDLDDTKPPPPPTMPLINTTTTTTTSLRRTRSGKGQLTGSQTAPSLSHAPDGSTTARDAGRGGASRRNSILMSVLRPHRRKDGSGSGGKVGRAEVSESAARRDTRLERSVGQLERIRSRGEGDRDDGEGEEEAVPSPSSPSPKSPRLRKRGSQSQRGASFSAAGVVAPAASPPPAAGGGGGGAAARADIDEMMIKVGRDGESELLFNPAGQIRRSSTATMTTSGNLGTRTLSGGGGGGFLHLHHHHLPQRRVSSMGMMDGGGASVDGGSVAGASSTATARKKRFGALRRMFGIDD
ncbi:hypothetical protein C8A01DRAFT_14202 [Parachaetomium inaequale]|uniref:Uncharacterized protein n=1 Tax=Parachaetomium inaequale TaxID=2588326 RepID=A0AAN6PJI5_9PEZI|nr:hypothetical protein C8A01DRAFT_14202 [Parachaetomium inaequale]